MTYLICMLYIYIYEYLMSRLYIHSLIIVHMKAICIHIEMFFIEQQKYMNRLFNRL
jgi:hypothetical protein